MVAKVSVELPVREYLVNLCAATRIYKAAALGLSPRGLMIWQRMAQANAFLNLFAALQLPTTSKRFLGLCWNFD